MGAGFVVDQANSFLGNQCVDCTTCTSGTVRKWGVLVSRRLTCRDMWSSARVSPKHFVRARQCPLVYLQNV